MSICIVIPSYNENENLNILLSEIYKIDLEDVDVVIVDDSKDSYQNQIKLNSKKFITYTEEKIRTRFCSFIRVFLYFRTK